MIGWFATSARTLKASGLALHSMPRAVRKTRVSRPRRADTGKEFPVPEDKTQLLGCNRWVARKRLHGLGAISQYGRMRLVLVRRIFRGLDNAELLRVGKGQGRIRPWRTSHA